MRRDVGVLDDRDPRRRGVLPLLDRRALLALLGVLQRVQVRARRHRQALHADADAGVVHEVEHLGHALLLLGADQLADAAIVIAEVEHRRRRRLDAHLVLDRRDLDVVRGAVGAIARHDEQGQALGAGRGVLGLGQDQVQDVLGQVVVAAGDEDLGAAELVLAAAHRLGLGQRAADVGAGVGLGQAHRAGVGAVVELGAVGRDLLLGAEVLDDVGHALGQRRVHVERRVGAAHDLLGHRVQRERPGLAAELLGDRQAAPADVVERLPRRLEAVGGS
jgi:hypothetical protein